MQKKRIELEDDFSQGNKIGQAEFHDLIQSVLNKRDDQFHGKWRSGVVYQSGDVVIYKHELWQVTGDEDNPDVFCSAEPPDQDERWKSIFVPEPDDDWYLYPEEPGENEEQYMSSTPNAACVGIGTGETKPLAKLEVIEEEEGRYLLGPKGMSGARFTMINLVLPEGYSEEEGFNYLATGVNTHRVVWTTDAPGGFIFQQGSSNYTEANQQIDCDDGDVLMVIVPNNDNLVRVGIGTPKPKGMLDVTDKKKGRFLVNPEDKDDPAISIINLDDDTEQNYLAAGVGAEFSVFVTDAPSGFTFKEGKEYGTYCSETDINQGYYLMTIQANEDHQPRVGIGSESPEAMLEITDDEKGQFLFNPEEMIDPVFSIINLQDKTGQQTDPNYLASGVGDELAVFVSDAPKGFVFKEGDNYGEFCAQERISQGYPLVVIRAADTHQPRVGIGTGDEEMPKAMLEITDLEKGQFLLNPEQLDDPVFVIVNLAPPDNPNYFASGVGAEKAVLVTDAPKGFFFGKGAPYDQYNGELEDESNEVLVVFRETGKVGIGTDDPITFVEATDQKNGRFLMHLDDRANPAFAIVNKTSEKDKNYLTVGANDDAAIFVTDCPKGFEFIGGAPIVKEDGTIDTTNPQLNIDQGAVPYVSIRPDDGGKVGINRVPSNYQFDVEGRIRAHMLYLNTDKHSITRLDDLRDALGLVEKLNPIIFKWKPESGLEGKQLGFFAHEVENIFDEPMDVVRDDDDLPHKSISYTSLIPIAIQAIKEQQTQIDTKADRGEWDSKYDELRNLITEMQNRINYLEDEVIKLKEKCK